MILTFWAISVVLPAAETAALERNIVDSDVTSIAVAIGRNKVNPVVRHTDNSYICPIPLISLISCDVHQ